MSSAFLLVRENHAIVDVALAFGDVAQLALQQGLAQRGDAVDVDMAFQMVVFVLDDAGTDTLKDFLVLLEILVEVLDADLVVTHHLLIDVGQAEAAFLERHHVAKGFDELGVDEHLLEALAFRIVRIEGVAVDDEQADGFVDLGCGQTDAFGMRQRFPHVLQQDVQLGIVGRDGLGDGLEGGVTVCDYW